MTLQEGATEPRRRLARLFRACRGDDSRFGEDPNWKELRSFDEYFHRDTGKGLGRVSDGWTSLTLLIMNDLAREQARTYQA